MEYSVSTADPGKLKSACAVVGIFSRRRMTAAAALIDKATGGLIGQALKRRDLEG